MNPLRVKEVATERMTLTAKESQKHPPRISAIISLEKLNRTGEEEEEDEEEEEWIEIKATKVG